MAVSCDPLERRNRRATRWSRSRTRGGGLPQSVTDDTTGGFEHNAERPIGRNAPRGDDRYRKGELLLATEEDFGPAAEGCRNQGQFTIASLKGSYNGEAWQLDAGEPVPPAGGREVVRRTRRRAHAPRPAVPPLANFCSAHYFDVDDSLVTYAWYGEGTRFLDISNPANPRQFAYWRPDDGIVWASYMLQGLHLHRGPHARCGHPQVDRRRQGRRRPASAREVVAPAQSKRQRAFLAKQASSWVGDPATGGLCLLPSY